MNNINTMGYQNPYMTNQMRYPNAYPITQTAPQNNSIIWVQGIEGAKGYQLSPNSIIMLLDSENDGIFYIKSSDNVGMCNLRSFKYQEITNTHTNNVDMSNYITREEFNSVVSKLTRGANNEQTVSTVKPTSGITE